MKKWIKKLLISSSAITLVGTGGVGAFIGAKQTKQTENLKAIIKDRSDNYIMSPASITTNRTHELILSFSSTNKLYESINTKLTIKKQGDAFFNYLTTSWAKSDDPTHNLCKKFSEWMIFYLDYDSIHSLFEQTNPHTWKGGFVVSDFIKSINAHLKSYTPITIYIYVDYVFLGHNKYGINYF